jgi:bacterial/archaeal transporter family-2 protein
MRFLIPCLLGVAAVAQAGLNRRMSANIGLAQATLANNAVLLLASVVFFVCAKNSMAVPASSVSGLSGVELGKISPLMYVLPGLLGIVIVAGVPWAMAQWGATMVFIGLMASQIVGSVIWDVFVESRAVTATQLASAALVVGSVALMAGRS